MAILLLDNYDSFTYNLYDYLQQAGADCTVVRNDALELLAFEPGDFDGVVLSPGPKRPQDAGMLPRLIAAWNQRLPILGICLGMQALGEFFGARLVKSGLPMHGKTSPVRHNGHPLFAGIPIVFSAMRYHSLVLQNLEKTPLNGIAYSDDGTLMALEHRELPLWGVQFHPESILTESGLQLIINWVEYVHRRTPNQPPPVCASC
ncbi:MAG: aminodeoxychorismate/anthranilate synthase component II [Saprospiraceae bacterium]